MKKLIIILGIFLLIGIINCKKDEMVYTWDCYKTTIYNSTFWYSQDLIIYYNKTESEINLIEKDSTYINPGWLWAIEHHADTTNKINLSKWVTQKINCELKNSK